MACTEIGHPFWLCVATTIERTVTSVRSGHGLSRTVRLFFCIPVVGNALFTNKITGPSCLDQTLCTHTTLASSDVRTLHHDNADLTNCFRHLETAMWIPKHVQVCAMGTVSLLLLLGAGLVACCLGV